MTIISKLLNITRGGNNSNRVFILFICFMIILAYITPLLIHDRVLGVDTYSHVFYTMNMHSTNSLFDFYERVSKRVLHPDWERNGYNYPFGVWLFGSTAAKVTGISPHDTAYLLQFIYPVLILLVFCLYSNIFLTSKKYRMLSLIFLLSMPYISIMIFRYRPSVFVIPFLLMLIYFGFKKISLKYIILMSAFTFCLCISHTGTYLFFISFNIVFLILYALLWGKFQKGMFVLTIITLLIYPITMNLFPHIHPEYVASSGWVITISNLVSSNLHWEFPKAMGQIFYEEFFVNKDIIYAVFFSALFYSICQLSVFMRSMVSKLNISINIKNIVRNIKNVRNFPLTLPVIGEVTSVSHSILATPFWIGPIHTVFSLICAFQINRIGKAIFLAVVVITIPTGASYAGGTGALREIYYLLIIIPITSALGFYYVASKLDRIARHTIWKVISGAILIGIFSALIVSPVIGNIYYMPTIAGEDYIIEGMKWLGTVGNEKEVCAGYALRQPAVYTNKTTNGEMGIRFGTEEKNFFRYLHGVFFQGSEYYLRALYSDFGVKYIISTDKVIRTLGGTPEKLKIDSNKELDKIYSNADFGIYNSLFALTSPTISDTNTTIGLNFNETYPEIQDRGGDYLIETNTYKVRIDKNTPEIKYLGDSKLNLLGSGYIIDELLLSWTGGPYRTQDASYALRNLVYSPIIQNNQITYDTILQNKNKTENWATLKVKYTFYQKAIKKEVIIMNDWESFNTTSTMYTIIYREQVTPLYKFTIWAPGRIPITRRIYPSEDTVRLGYTFKESYINDETDGIYSKYESEALYRSGISYQGSTESKNYALISSHITASLNPSDSISEVEYISIGDKDISKDNIDHYTSVSLYPYPYGEIPIVLTSYLYSLNRTNEKQFNYTINIHDKLKSIGISDYTEGINMQDDEINKGRMNQLLDYGIDVIGYENFYHRFPLPGNYDTLDIQEDKIQRMIDNAKTYYNISLNGFIAGGLNYNMDTIDVLSDKNILFAVVSQRGVGHPRTAYYHGNKTGLVLLPISQTSSNILECKLIIDQAIENDDACILLWRSEVVGKPEYIDNVTDVVIRYAQSKGMVFTTPHKIAEHFKLLQNVSGIISKDIDTTTISVENKNDKAVVGVTFKVVMPKIDYECLYVAKNGAITRMKKEIDTCIYYVSTDIDAKETKVVTIEPDITRKRFKVNISDLIEGEITIFVKDENENPVQEVTVVINDIIYKTTENGILKINLRRGYYKVKLEKLGFETESFELNVKGRIYLIGKHLQFI